MEKEFKNIKDPIAAAKYYKDHNICPAMNCDNCVINIIAEKYKSPCALIMENIIKEHKKKIIELWKRN